MLRKIIETFKATVGVWALILVPLLICVYCVKTAINRDVKRCVDTFMQSEGSGISKYMSLQFDNSVKELEVVVARASDEVADKDALKEELKDIAKSNDNVAMLSVYDEDGKFLANSSGDESVDLEEDQVLDASKDGFLYKIDQLDDKSIVIKYQAARDVVLEDGKSKKYLFELVMKWKRYEEYMMHLEQGSLPRIFYIVSPDCKRYVSFNSLPRNNIGNTALAALGMHLAKEVSNINSGISDIAVDSVDFRILKEEIKMPSNLSGSKFFIMLVTDDNTVEQLNNNMFEVLPLITMVFLIILLIVCLVIARFYNKIKEQLEIANVIQDSTPLSIVIFKASDGHVIKINLTASTLLRIEKEDVAKINMWNMFIEDEDKSYIVHAIDSNISVLNYEVLVQSFGSGTFWSICSASPISINEEKYIVLAVLDINRRKEIEKKLANNAALLEKQIAERTADLELKAKELEQSNTLLEKSKFVADEANNAKSKFLASMSNELKTPLNAIIGYSEILKEEAMDRKDAVSSDDLSKIIGSAKHLLSLIDEILDLSNIEAGKTQLFFENIELVSLIKDVEGITMPLVAKNDNSMFMEYPKDIGIMYSDSTKIRQCLLNLLSNAAKFTEFGKITLRIDSLVKGGIDFVEFSVIDTGIGIESYKLPNIFESFQGGNSSAGLGLSLTKKYIELLGGTVTVESEIGAGSKFVVRLPRVCKTESCDSVEVKNQSGERMFDDIIEEISSTVP
ncbi:MAG: PAS domain-containing protein [Holosporaceae bacterium]|jgi:PAS domain S-box-containing protein|nr:PAS domain-containing protein [Holosporaceae bacterium]